MIIASQLFSISLLVGFALFVLHKQRNQQTAIFSLILISAAIWLSANVLVLSANNSETANLWGKIAYIGVVFIPISILHFALGLAEIRLKPAIVQTIYGVGVVFIILALLTNILLDGAHKYEWGYWFKAGWFHPVFLVFFFILLATALALIFNRSRTAESKSDQFVIKRVFWAYLIASLGSVDYLPDYGVNIIPLGFIPVTICALMLTHLVIFRNFMNIEVINWDRFGKTGAILNLLKPYQKYTAEVIEYVQISPHDNVLVVGPITEPFKEIIQKIGAAHTFLEQNYEITQPRDPQHSFNHMLKDLSARSFDKIILVEVLHILPKAIRQAIMTEYLRLLKPQGALAVVVPYPNSNPIHLYKSHLSGMIKETGFISAAKFVIKNLFGMARHLYYTTIIISRQEVLGLIDFIGINELFALLRQSGFTPYLTRKVKMNESLLSISTVSVEEKASHTILDPTLRIALPEIEKVVGKENVFSTSSEISKYRKTTTADARSISAVVRPSSTNEIQQIVKIANFYKIPLYPISTGHNWGYGTASPVNDHNILLDLGRMNRILEINTELAYAVIEPGVTQGQLANYLAEHNIPLVIDPTGAGPSCSLIGNALERGFGLGPYGDHFLSSCSMEVVLPNGEVLNTGFGHYESSKSTYLYKWGVGPYIDGLFTQSNFGIVTRMGLWLAPKIEKPILCYFNIADDKGLAPVVEALRPLVLEGVIPTSLMIVNRQRALTMLLQYPWDDTSGKTPIPNDLLDNIARKKQLFLWNGATALYGTKEQMRATKKALRKALRGKVARITFVSKRFMTFLEFFQKPLSVLLNLNIPEMIELVKAFHSVVTGTPTERSLHAPYWRNTRNTPPKKAFDPANDKCGIIWFPPIVPMTAHDVTKFLEIINPICDKYGFEACTGFTSINKRVFDCTFPLLFDQDNPDEVKRVQQCFRELLDQCIEAGYIPYRTGISSMNMIRKENDSFWTFVDRLKEAVDPNNIMSPGRYTKTTSRGTS